MPASVSNFVLLIGCGCLLGCAAEPEPKSVEDRQKTKVPLAEESYEGSGNQRLSALGTRRSGKGKLAEENAALRKRVAELEAALGMPPGSGTELQAVPERAPQFDHYITEFPPLVIAGTSAIYAEPPVELTDLPADQNLRDGPLSADAYAMLLSGDYAFRPSNIPSSEVPVTESTSLQVGQEVQLKYGSTWWAATVTGLEPDGMVRASYFGWDRSYDEIVPRSDLQLDTFTREKAVQQRYPLSGAP